MGMEGGWTPEHEIRILKGQKLELEKQVTHWRVLSGVQKETCERWMKISNDKDVENDKLKTRIEELRMQLRNVT